MQCRVMSLICLTALCGGMLQAAEFSPYSRVLPPEAFDNPNLNGFDKSLPDFFISPEFPFILSPDEQTLTVTLGNTTSEKAQQLLDRIAAKNSNAVLIVRLTGLIEVTHKPLSLSDRTCLIFERGGHIVAAEDCIAKSLLLIRDCQFLSIKGIVDPRHAPGKSGPVLLDGGQHAQTAILIEQSGSVHLDYLSLTGFSGDGIVVRGCGPDNYQRPVTLTRSVVRDCRGNGVTARNTAAFITLDSIFKGIGKAGLVVDAPSSIVANTLCRFCATGISVFSSSPVITRNQVLDNGIGIELGASSEYSLVYENRIHKNNTGIVMRGKNATVGWNRFTNGKEIDCGGIENVVYTNAGLAAAEVSNRGTTFFNPPTAANFHEDSTIWMDERSGSPALPRIDLEIESEAGGLTIAAVNSQLRQARTKHSEAVLVVHLIGDFFFSSDEPLQIPEFTCIILEGQIVCDDEAGFDEDCELIQLQSAGCVSFSGGRIITRGKVFSVISGANSKNVLLLDGVQLNLRPAGSGGGESPVNAISSKKHRGPFVVRNCEVSSLGHRGIWAHVSKRVYALGNTCRAGSFSIDFDAYCFQSAALFNHITGNDRHSGVFFEECVKNNIAFANYVEKSKVHGISMWTESVKGVTENNVVACNTVQGGSDMKENGSGIAVGGRSDEKTSAHNFFFNNRLNDVRGRAAILLRQNSDSNYFAENVVRRAQRSVLNYTIKPQTEQFEPQEAFHSIR